MSKIDDKIQKARAVYSNVHLMLCLLSHEKNGTISVDVFNDFCDILDEYKALIIRYEEEEL
jgi:hypothetical protein